MNYPRPSNNSKRGWHWTASNYPVHANFQWHLDWMQRCGTGWVKYVADGDAELGCGDSGIQFGVECLKRGMIPIHRFYKPANHNWIDANDNAVRACVANGIKYIEPMNEPDLSVEWGDGHLPQDWLQRSFQTWIGQAQHILDLGGIPLSPALASGAFHDRGEGAGTVLLNPFEWVRDAGITDFVCAIHNYTGNHPINYPYDAVNQVGEPLTQTEYDKYGPEAWDYRPIEHINIQRERDKNPGDTIYEDDSCFLAVLRFRELLDEAGFQHVPIMTTEGGPVHTDLWDGRYPRVVPNLFIEMLEQELAWMSDKDWYYCLCPWLWANNSAGGTGGWADCQIFHPGHPWVDSDGVMPVVKWLIDRPVSEDGNIDTEPVAPPQDPEPPMPPVTPPTELLLTWLIPDWNDAELMNLDNTVAGQTAWKLVRAELAPDNMANTVWIHILDEQGQATQAAVTVQNINGDEFTLPHKPDEPYNQPMWKNDKLMVWIGEPDISDIVYNIHGAYWDEPGVNAFHVGYILTFQKWIVPEDEKVEPPVPPTEITDDTVREAAWNRLYPEGVNYNPSAMFQAVARERGYGAPNTQEFDVGNWRVQGFVLKILYAEIGQWQDVMEAEW
ncbi:MAG: hypothetical protein ABIG63_06760 [Chloroflexota bacterium]